MPKPARRQVDEIEEFDASAFAELFGELDDEPTTTDASPTDWPELAEPAMHDDELDVDEDDGWPTPESASYASYPGSAEPPAEEEDPEEELAVSAAIGSRKIGAEPDRRERRNPPARVRRAQPDDDEVPATGVDGAPAQHRNRTVALTLMAGLLVALAAIVFVSYGGARPRPGVAEAATRSASAPPPTPALAPAARVQRSPSAPTSPPAPAVVATRRESRVPAQRKPHRKPRTAVVATRAQAPPAPQRQPSSAPSTPSAPPPPARVYVPPAAAAPAARSASPSPAPGGLSYLGGG